MKPKQQKRDEAQLRQEEYDKLSRKEKIKRVKARRGESKRELQRLGA